MQVCQDGRISTAASVVVLGMFDGVHLGHRVLLQKARTIANRMKVPMVVQTFSEHPLCLLAPEKCPPMLTTLPERIALIEKQGADIFCATPFTPQVRDTPPEEFIGRLVQQWKPRAVVIGFNYSFGQRGEGTAAYMEAIGHALGFETFVVPAIRLSGEVISATRIRTLLTQGNVRQARFLLGRPYAQAMTLLSRVGERCVIQPMQDGKQAVRPGRYRTLLSSGQNQYPWLAQSKLDGTLVGDLPPALTLESATTLQYLTQCD